MGRSWSSSYQRKRLVPADHQVSPITKKGVPSACSRAWLIGRGAKESAPQGILLLLLLRPGDGGEGAGLSAAGPRPPASTRCASSSRPASVARTRTRKVLLAVPEAVDPFLEIGSGQVHPHDHLGVRVCKRPAAREGQFLLFPHVYRSRQSRRRKQTIGARAVCALSIPRFPTSGAWRTQAGPALSTIRPAAP